MFERLEQYANMWENKPAGAQARDMDYDRILLEPYNYLMEVPGKNVRSVLIHAFNKWLRIPSDKLAAIEEVVNMLHTASLLYVLHELCDPFVIPCFK
jgi:geranylgeranyl pyrophosphate synthase